MTNKKYFLKELCNYNIYMDTVYISNKYNGNWFKIPKEIFDLLVISQKEKKNIEDLYQFIMHDEDKNYFSQIVDRLELIGVLHDTPELKVNKNRIPKIVISLTNRCNLNCDYCCVDSKLEDTADLTLEDVKCILNKVIKFNPGKIVFSGGEPMSRPDFFDILKYLHTIYKGKVQLATNATYINKSNVKLLLKYINAFDISLDGYDEESCSKIRGKNIFNKTTESIRLIQESGCNNISVSMVIGKNNISQMGMFYDFCNSINVKPIIRPFTKMSRGAISASKYLNNINDIKYLGDKDKLDSLKLNMTSSAITCRAGESQLFVNYDGNIYPCPLLQKDKYIICNIRDLNDKAIYNILNGNYDVLEKIDELRTINNKNCKGCKFAIFCNNCLSTMDSITENKNIFKHNCKNIKYFFEIEERNCVDNI